MILFSYEINSLRPLFFGNLLAIFLVTILSAGKRFYRFALKIVCCLEKSNRCQTYPPAVNNYVISTTYSKQCLTVFEITEKMHVREVPHYHSCPRRAFPWFLCRNMEPKQGSEKAVIRVQVC